MEPNSSSAPIVVSRWPTEKPLLVLTAIAAAIMWLVLIVSGIGIVYIVMIATFLAVMHLILVGNLRGSAVRLGPQQFPELYSAIDTLSRRMRMRTPEAYLMQAGGALNAFATRFVGSNIIVLYSDLLAACGDDTAARDMIIAHELGHIKCGHVRWQWLLLPGAFIPFLGTALSRAREYTCDRYGLAGAGDADGAAMGLTILASGRAHASRVNKSELARQREVVSRSGLMTLAEWFGTHPPLSKRIAQINPALVGHTSLTGMGPAIAGALVFGIPIAIGFLVWQVGSSDLAKTFKAAMDSAAVRPVAEAEDPPYVAPPDAAERARADIGRIAAFVHEERSRGSLPWNIAELKERMAVSFRTDFPVDPFDGNDYGYDQRGEHFVLWSSGADQKSWTADDIRYDSRAGRFVGETAPRR
jgi:Zn-dependent protease with chaperone function